MKLTTTKYNKFRNCSINKPLQEYVKHRLKSDIKTYKESINRIGGIYYPLTLLKLLRVHDIKENEDDIWDYLNFSFKSNELSKFFNYSEILDFLRFYSINNEIKLSNSLRDFEKSISNSLFLFSEEELSNLKKYQAKFLENKLFNWKHPWNKYNFPFDNSKIFLENLDFFEEFKNKRFEIKTTISGSIILIDNEKRYKIKIEDYDKNNKRQIDLLKTLYYKKTKSSVSSGCKSLSASKPRSR